MHRRSSEKERIMRGMTCLLFSAALLLLLTAGCGGGGDGGGDQPAPQVDRTIPFVISTNPSHESSAIPTNRAITLTFNKPIDPSTLSPARFTLVSAPTGTPVAGQIAYDETSRTAAFRTDDLLPGTSYIATISKEIADLAGNRMAADYSWQFTTAPLATAEEIDLSPPVVVSTYPAPDAVSIPLDTAILITFSEGVDPATINAQTVIVRKDGTTVVPGTLSYVGTTASFKPTTPLQTNTNYVAEVTVGVKDLAGNALLAPYQWSFTTLTPPAVPLEAPQVISVGPVDGATNVPVDSAIVVSFDAPILPFEFGLIDGRPVAVTFNADYTMVTMKPTVSLKRGVTYTARIIVADVTGKQMDEPFEWQFSTEP